MTLYGAYRLTGWLVVLAAVVSVGLVALIVWILATGGAV